jgi:hypothetical protein
MPTPLIYRTVTMLAAIQAMPTHRTFLRDRYFPTDSGNDIFPSEEVLVEYRNGNKKMAPCVMPRKGGITIEREGYRIYSYTPPFIAPQRSLTIDDLNKKGFGEQLFSDRTPQQRQAQILNNDLREFDQMISAREEYMASQCMINNGYILKHYADEYGGTKFEEWEIRFYDEAANPAQYTPAITWDEADADIYGDLSEMVYMLTSNGLPATELVMARGVSKNVLNNETMQKYMDLKNINLGKIDPRTLPEGATVFGIVNVDGHTINLISYDETYENEAGDITPYIPAGKVILTAPAAGRGVYGAVTQIEQDDGEFHTYPGRRVPKYLSDPYSEIRDIKVTSRPLLMPKNKNPWISAQVL